MKTSKLNWSSYSLIIILSFIVSSCQTGNHGKDLKVNNNSELASALSQVKPGDVIVMADGTWNDASIFIDSSGTSSAPITLQAETPGKVMLTGQSSIILGGDYIIIDGLHFKDGYSPSRAVIRFGKDSENVANHCIVRNCVIEDFNKPQRNKSDLWVLFHGRNNELDHCYLAGKSNRGPTIRVDLEGNQSIYNYHKITNNHFGPRPPKGGPSAETIQIGNSFTSMAPSHTLVANNLFDRCNGEVEVISSKTNFNEFRNNVFYKSEGSLVTRHGNYCLLDGNYFIGDEKNNNIGGIRLIGSGHTVTNNYFYKLKGENFRSPLAVMNGIPKSPLNRYIQVTDVLVAYNSWIDCISPLQFGVGSNIDQKDVLPASEIRSARPIRTTVANNLIYNSSPNRLPIVAHDKLDGILFKSNYINKQDNEFSNQESLVQNSFELKEIEENIFAPETDLSDLDLYNGFEFDKISLDLFGNSRQENNSPGAILSASSTSPGILDTEKYGPAWYTDSESDSSSNTITLSPANDLNESISKASSGDIIQLNAGIYEIDAPLTIDKKIIIKSSNGDDIPHIKYTGEKATPLFEMNPKGDLKLEKIKLSGNKT
ncbi:MAG: alginate lyase, partial [Saprospiraceae bacterium]|nr:alginate lyase [Saprospiraceae bacterium]